MRRENLKTAWTDKEIHYCEPPPIPDVDRYEAVIALLEAVLVAKLAIQRNKSSIDAEALIAERLYVLQHLPRRGD